MELVTRHFGLVSYEEENYIYFPDGLYGLSPCRRFLLLRFDAQNDVMFCLQSTEDPALSLVLFDPFALVKDFSPRLSAADRRRLGLQADADGRYYVVAVVGATLADTTINLRCPIVCNSDTRTACQVFLENADYSFRHPAFSAKQEGVPCSF